MEKGDVLACSAGRLNLAAVHPGARSTDGNGGAQIVFQRERRQAMRHYAEQAPFCVDYIKAGAVIHAVVFFFTLADKFVTHLKTLGDGLAPKSCRSGLVIALFRRIDAIKSLIHKSKSRASGYRNPQCLIIIA